MRVGRPRDASPRRGLLRRVGLAAGAAVLLAACGTTDRADFPLDALSPEGPMARAQDNLWQIVFPVAVIVFILVQGLILVAVFKFRDRGESDELPKQVHGNTKLEIIWTAVPAAILAVIAVPTVQTIFQVAAEPDAAERIDVRVVGKQYWWQFEYPDAGVVTANEFTIPVDTPVWIELDGFGDHELADGTPQQEPNLVLHSFWVPRLAGKIDYVPNHTNRLMIQADDTGTFFGQCAEFCGLSHANMRFRVHAVEQDEYEQWLAAQAEPAASPDDEVASRGEEIVGQSCLICHAIEGHPDNEGRRVGPDLTHLMTRETFAGSIFDLDDEDQLRAWIQNAPAEKPGAQMNPFDFDDDELDAILAYLRTLE